MTSVDQSDSFKSRTDHIGFGLLDNLTQFWNAATREAFTFLLDEVHDIQGSEFRRLLTPMLGDSTQNVLELLSILNLNTSIPTCHTVLLSHIPRITEFKGTYPLQCAIPCSHLVSTLSAASQFANCALHLLDTLGYLPDRLCLVTFLFIHRMDEHLLTHPPYSLITLFARLGEILDRRQTEGLRSPGDVAEAIRKYGVPLANNYPQLLGKRLIEFINTVDIPATYSVFVQTEIGRDRPYT